MNWGQVVRKAAIGIGIIFVVAVALVLVTRILMLEL